MPIYGNVQYLSVHIWWCPVFSLMFVMSSFVQKSSVHPNCNQIFLTIGELVFLTIFVANNWLENTVSTVRGNMKIESQIVLNFVTGYILCPCDTKYIIPNFTIMPTHHMNIFIIKTKTYRVC